MYYKRLGGRKITENALGEVVFEYDLDFDFTLGFYESRKLTDALFSSSV